MLGFLQPETIINGLLELSFGEIFAAVETRIALFDFVNGLRKSGPLQAPAPTHELDPSSSSGGTVEVSGVPHSDAANDCQANANECAPGFQPRFFHKPSVTTWYAFAPKQKPVEKLPSFFISSPRSDAQSKPTSLEVM